MISNNAGAEKAHSVKKQEIIDYINRMEIKRAGIGGGGLDRVDAYFHIQQIVSRYDELVKEVALAYEEEIMRLNGLIAGGSVGQNHSTSLVQDEVALSFTEDEVKILKELAKRNSHLSTML